MREGANGAITELLKHKTSKKEIILPIQYIAILLEVQYSTVQYSTVQYSTVQYSTVQYSTSVWAWAA